MLVAGYASLGLLVGFIVGATSAPITTSILGILFVFAGSSAAFHLSRAPGQQRLVGSILLAFSSFCLIGSIGGAAVKENHLLTWPGHLQNLTRNVPTGHAYSDIYKSSDVDELEAIDQEYRNHEITAEDAYRRTRALIMQQNQKK